MNSRILLIFALFLSLPAIGQKYDWQPLTREVVISGSDSSIRTNILIKRENQTIDKESMYYWYNKGQINCNMGGYAGELLHGKYFVFDINKSMITQGYFEYGLMAGTWKKWYSNGQLKLIADYKKGQLNGQVKQYDADGNLIEITSYRNGKLIVKENKIFKLLKKKEKDSADSVQSENNSDLTD